jgi:hypothetical protein
MHQNWYWLFLKKKRIWQKSLNTYNFLIVNGLTLHFLQIFVELVNDIEHGLDSQQTKNVFGSITDVKYYFPLLIIDA